MINFEQHVNRFRRLDGVHWIEVRRRVAGQETIVSGSPFRSWINLRTTDNPNPITVLSQPIVKSLEIYTFPWADVQNGDFIIAFKVNLQGRVIGTWRGVCGEPFVYMPFMTFNMEMQALGGDVDIPTLPPLPTESIIYINFVNEENIRIHETITYRATIGKPLEVPYLDLWGFTYSHVTLDGVRIDVDTVEFTPEKQHYTIVFHYIGAKQPTAIKVLVNSIFRRANGTTGNGFHLYNNMPIRFIDDNHVEVLDLPGLRFLHDTSFRQINLSTTFNNTNSNILVLYPMMNWKRIVGTSGNILELIDYVPTLEEKSAYVIPF